MTKMPLDRESVPTAAAERVAENEGWLRVRVNKITGDVEADVVGRPTSAQRRLWEEWCQWHHETTDQLVLIDKNTGAAYS